jgi:hypothetical protein
MTAACGAALPTSDGSCALARYSRAGHASRFLDGRKAQATRSLPGSLLLAELKQHDELTMIPVIMLTTPRAEEDIVQLLAARQRVHQQTGRLGAFHRGDPADRHVFLTLVKLPA